MGERETSRAVSRWLVGIVEGGRYGCEVWRVVWAADAPEAIRRAAAGEDMLGTGKRLRVEVMPAPVGTVLEVDLPAGAPPEATS